MAQRLTKMKKNNKTPALASLVKAALVALLKLCPDMPLERKLPDGYRETWLEAIGNLSEERRHKLSNAERENAIRQRSAPETQFNNSFCDGDRAETRERLVLSNASKVEAKQLQQKQSQRILAAQNL